ncbi:MAG: M28 family peptidase [Anaerolineae bacterium]|jgi:hypothetical protein
MARSEEVVEGVWAHVRYLSVILGGRGSCTPVEAQAARYAADRMREVGVADVRLEPFQGSPSTYQPYALALGLGLVGTLLMWIGDLLGPDFEFWMLILAAISNGLGAWGIIAESDLAVNWMRWLLPRANSYNAVGVIPAAVQARQRVVLSAHLDSHRTPFFFASQRGLLLFRALVLLAWLGMALEALLYALAALFAWDWVFWFGVVALLQVAVLDMCLRADTTPFSPGANDNASGVALALELGQHLVDEPLSQTEVWLVFTGCEETAAYGMAAFLDAHATSLGDGAFFVVLDAVGLGRVVYLTQDGLVLKRKSHPRALALARQAREALPHLAVEGGPGVAYTDGLLATKRGKMALTLSTWPPRDDAEPSHWHRMSDTIDNLDEASVLDAYEFAWQLLQEVDRA